MSPLPGACKDPGESGRQPQGGCPVSVCCPARSCPGRGTGKGYREDGEGHCPHFPEDAGIRRYPYPVRGTSTWSGLEGYSGQGLEATRWAGVRGCQLAGPGPLDHCGGPPAAPGRGGVLWPGSGPGSAVASSLVRDRWTTAGARSLDPRRGGGVLACQTFDRGPRWLTAGPGLPVKCGGPVLWTHARTKRFAESAVAFVRPGPLGKSWGSRFGQETACRVFG
jgi:hypothetical protein